MLDFVKMTNIFDEVRRKRTAQYEKWGEQNYPSLCQLLENAEPGNRCAILDIPMEADIKKLVSDEHKDGKQHWATIALEEFIEVITAENDYERREELLDLIAVCVQQIECIDRNDWAKPPVLAEEKYTDESIMSFGKHKGEKLANVPAQYLLWMLENNVCHGLLKDYIVENKEQLAREIIR